MFERWQNRARGPSTPFSNSGSACNVCNHFAAPKTQLSFQDIQSSSNKGCFGCLLLEKIISRYSAVGDEKNGWVSLTAPSVYSSLYQVYSNVFGSLELFVLAERSPLLAIPLAPRVSGNTASDLALSRTLGWLNTCLLNHTRCRKQERLTLPSRLLDLSSIDAQSKSGNVRLVSSKSGIQTKNYACLSHCWGHGPMLRTTQSTLAEHEAGIQLSSFPRTFQESMIFTLKLGVSYLWIDSLCIIQDSSEDWDIESKQMADIYTSAHFTIAASKASGSEEGCFSETPTQYRGDEIKITPKNGDLFSVYARRPINHNTWPLLKRAWVFQERLLSRRIIHFTNEEIAWECMEYTTCECSRALSSWSTSGSIDSKPAHHDATTSKSKSKLADEWRSMVAKYTTMGLTFEKDIFPALSGLATDMQRRGLTNNYYAGMWHDSLAIDMLWRMKLGHPNIESRPQIWRAPSWSWASVVQHITYETMAGRPLNSAAIRKVYAKVTGVCSKPAGIDPLGAISAGRIIVRGKLAAAEPYTDSGRMDGPYLRIGEETGLSPQWDDCKFESRFKVDPEHSLFLLRMVETNSERGKYEEELICLVLQRNEENSQVFRRVGYISRYWPKETNWFKKSKDTEVTII